MDVWAATSVTVAAADLVQLLRTALLEAQALGLLALSTLVVLFLLWTLWRFRAQAVKIVSVALVGALALWAATNVDVLRETFDATFERLLERTEQTDPQDGR